MLTQKQQPQPIPQEQEVERIISEWETHWQTFGKSSTLTSLAHHCARLHLTKVSEFEKELASARACHLEVLMASTKRNATLEAENKKLVEEVERAGRSFNVIFDKSRQSADGYVCEINTLRQHLRELHAASEFATFDALGRDSHVARLRAARASAAKVLKERAE